MFAPNTRTTRTTLTRSRIVALTLIAIVAAGLAWLRFSPDAGSVTVPAGAKAGDLILAPCDYGTEDGTYDADCGTLVVPENRLDPQSRLIALPVTRIHARSANPTEPIFRLEGGPGGTNMDFPMASRYAEHRDVVLVGYRGVDGSSVLDCPEVESSLKHSRDFLGERSMEAYADAFRHCADRLQDDGVDLAGYTLAQRVDDLEAARLALGYDRIDLLSESAGTRTAMVYSWRHPNSIHRSVMVGANPPGHFLWDARTTDEQVDRYAALCAEDATCSARGDLSASMRRTEADMPDRWWFLPIKDGNVRVASFYGLMDTSSEAAPISAPMTLQSWASAARGDASGLWFMSLAADLAFPQSFVWGDVAAASRADAQAARAYFAGGLQDGATADQPGTAFLWGGGRLVDAWPASPGEDEYSHMRASNVETLVIGGELDPATPPQVATRELLPYLPNGHQVVLDGFAHTTDFWTYQQDAGSRLITTFLDSGRVDTSLYEPQRVDFTPGVTHTVLAKGVAATMIGLALLTVLSLLWMAHRAHQHGGFGRKASATLRSLVAVVLGLGGWFLGALIVITALPGVPLDHELLAVLAVGVPVGLGVYYAWVRGDSTTRSRAFGRAVAATGALAGAWLGFHAAPDMLALVTAILGAVAAANLGLIVLDVRQAPSVEEPVVAVPTLDEPSPTVEAPTPAGVGMA